MIDYEDLYSQQRDFLWGYSYRLTGDAAEAEDVVQETFVRAMERPPADTARPWRPWLVRVATNLVRDRARYAKRREYVGPWLPSPVRTEPAAEPPAREPDAAGRYELAESATVAFLLALEALTAHQRAVLLLRGVYDYTVREAAEALGISVSNVKTTLHRARQALAGYDTTRLPLDAARIRQTGDVLRRLLRGLAEKDTESVAALLAEDVRSRSDGNGHFYAARVPVEGRERVLKLYQAIFPRRGEPIDAEIVVLNGLPAVVAHRADPPEGYARFYTMAIDLDSEGRIQEIYATVAPEKLAAIRGAAGSDPSGEPSEPPGEKISWRP